MSETATDVLTRAADIIESHITSRFKRRQLAEGNARDLAGAGLLTGGHSRSSNTIRAQVEAILQCRQDWVAAERIAAELDAAGLLKGSDHG
ncbi:hypothetical protein ACVCAH_11515 [Micromonospora sp. LZ34]